MGCPSLGRTLTQAVRSRGGALDPIVVWWSGKRWYVLDGHHRMRAYRTFNNGAGAGKPITETPVEVFAGTVAAAHAKAVEANSKNHLRMEPADKADAAWRMVCLAAGAGNASAIGLGSGVTRQTVGKMQKHYAELRLRFPGVEPLDQSWKQVMDAIAGRDPKEWNDDEKEQQAQEWAERLTQVAGNKLQKSPGILARALEIYSPALIAQLIETPVFEDRVKAYVRTAMALGEWDEDELTES